MMQLLCDGRYLDLYDNADVQFTHDNPLFAFDDLKCERTTQFKLPTTPINDSVLGLARIPAYSGIGMRRKFDAQLILGTIVKDGYLYVGSYDGKDYQCIFVTGELVGLQKAKDAGKIREYYLPIATTVWGQMYDAELCINDVWKGAKYLQTNVGEPTKMPSMQLKSIIEGACAKLGLSITMPAGSEKYRLIPAALEPFTKDGIVFHSTKNKPVSPDYYANKIVDMFDAFQEIAFPIYDITGRVVYYDDQQLQEHGYCFSFDQLTTPVAYIRGWKAKMDMFFEKKYNPNIAMLRRTDGTFTVYPGGYDRNTGSVLLDNVVSIDAFGHKHQSGDYNYNVDNSDFFAVQAGDEFAFIDYDDIQIMKSDPVQSEEGQDFLVAQFAHNGVRYADGGQPEYLIETKMTTGYKTWQIGDTGDIEFDAYVEGDTIPLYPFMPDVTLIDLVKAIAYMEGKVLNYTDANGITFEDLDTSNYPKVDVDTLTARKDVSRTFANYAQLNIVRFDSDDTVYDYEQLTSEYTIDNVNIDKEKELGKVFASEGSDSYGENIDEQTFDPDKHYVLMRNEDKAISKDTFGLSVSGEEYLMRVDLPANAGVQHLCDMSTMFKVNIRMSAYEYYQITEKTLLNIDGTLYMWTSRQWQKNVAQFTLAKI